jgi:hypothetical protein
VWILIARLLGAMDVQGLFDFINFQEDPCVLGSPVHYKKVAIVTIKTDYYSSSLHENFVS